MAAVSNEFNQAGVIITRQRRVTELGIYYTRIKPLASAAHISGRLYMLRFDDG